MSETPYNVDLLMQVREKIETEPEKHYQAAWATSAEKPTERMDCGTTYCVAGWACALEGVAFAWRQSDDYGWEASLIDDDDEEWMSSIPQRAQELLGLNHHERSNLFAGSLAREDVLTKLDRLIEAGKNGERVPDGTL